MLDVKCRTVDGSGDAIRKSTHTHLPQINDDGKQASLPCLIGSSALYRTANQRRVLTKVRI